MSEAPLETGSLEALMRISREEFDQQRRPRLGASNPERMQIPFWDWMIRGDEASPANEDSKKVGYSPYHVRDQFQIPTIREDGPIWTFERMGSTRTELPDGRIVCVGGEHEDHYDPDFFIYNDVIIFRPDDRIEVYGYPKEVFLPTDFHSATLVGDQIIVIGCLGYPKDRRPCHTPVYALNLSTYKVAQISTSGEQPGWLYEHEAVIDQQGFILIEGGWVCEEWEGKSRIRRNIDDYSLDLGSMKWRRLTKRKWQQISIKQADRHLFVVERHPSRKALFPSRTEHKAELGDDWGPVRFDVQGVSVSVTKGVSNIEIIVEGELPDQVGHQIAEEIRSNVELSIQRPCVLVRI